ncbi:MAG: metallophosphoesterase [Clostridiales bacterium]|nr:metallophosphoesterase [Clostridiales bacterium]
MAIYAIGDLHLSLSVDKPMDVFGDNWTDYMEKIKTAWLELVKPEDYVLLPGDVCWAISLEEAKIDLAWIDALPGKKIISRGNHDYWWETLKKMNPLYESITFIHNTYTTIDGWAICGSRGWLSPNDSSFTEQDEKIYNRECHRLRISLDKAKTDGYSNILVMLHYPPTNEKKDVSPIQEILEDYQVKHVVYGHLHTQISWSHSLDGDYNNIKYYLVSSDYLNFIPKKIDI